MNLLEKLPTLITDVDNPRSFPQMEEFLREIFQDSNFHVKEAGYYNNAFVGVVYYGEKTEEVDSFFKLAKKHSVGWSQATD